MQKIAAKLALLFTTGAVLATGSALLVAPEVPLASHINVDEISPPAAVLELTPREPRALSFAPAFGVPVSREQVLAFEPEQSVTVPAFQLTGFIASGAMKWAVIVDGGESHVVREGERFSSEYEISQVGKDRVEITFEGGILSLKLDDGNPTRTTASLSVAQTRIKEPQALERNRPYRQMVKSVAMSRQDVEAILALAIQR